MPILPSGLVALGRLADQATELVVLGRLGRDLGVDDGHELREGLDAVVDCLLLSRAHTLIRTASNLSLCSTLFNPSLPDRLLNPER